MTRKLAWSIGHRRLALLASAVTAGALAAAAGAGCNGDDTDPASSDAAADGAADAGTSDVLAADTFVPDAGHTCDDAGTDLPRDLACTGLYADFAAKSIAPENRPYTPGLAFFSDGAEKSRWIHLPDGTKIDTTDLDEWVFPVGTKVWKEFRLGGKRIETRMFVKRATDDWARTTYAWNASESEATRLKVGRKDVLGSYEIPDETMCVQCHGGRKDKLLGFEAVSLALPGASGLTLRALATEGRLTAAPVITDIALPNDDAGLAGPALGWLHINCGVACHNAAAPGAGYTGFHTRLSAKAWFDAGASPVTPMDTDAWKTGMNVPHGSFEGMFPADAGYLRFKSGDDTRSVAIQLDSLRGPVQMPPIATHVVDDAGVAAVTRWVDSLPK